MEIPFTIANELSLRTEQVSSVIRLFDEGATVPFIARYRKEMTGGLDEDKLREIQDRFSYLTLLTDRKATIIKSVDEQGLLTDELLKSINECTRLQELEDLYLPYKPKRKTRGTIAKAKGLEPLALFILDQPLFTGDFENKLSEFVNEELGVNTSEEALQGAKDIIAEMINENAPVRKFVREYLLNSSFVTAQKAKETGKSSNLKQLERERKEVYKVYYEFNCDIKKIKPYHVLALNRGEKENALKVSMTFDQPAVFEGIRKAFLSYTESVFDEVINECIEDSFKRLTYPSIEKEARNFLTEQADLHAINVFASNLRQLLLQPPLFNKTVAGIDPGFASGCKVAIIDETGKFITGKTIYPHPPQNRLSDAVKIMSELIGSYKVDVIAIGNGTASRETEMFIAKMIKEYNLNCNYTIVNEAGASVYSASPAAKKEFPDLDASLRGNISIGRRLIDPLAELVKIDPKSIGVGLYQHDVDQKMLAEKLDAVVESCVNHVGVDVNTASAQLLTYVSGLNKRIAENIISYRSEKGRFSSREELKNVKGLGEKAFEQAAGFLKVRDGLNPLDNTFIHPESYEATHKLLDVVGFTAGSMSSQSGLLSETLEGDIEKLAVKIGVGVPTLTDIIENLKKPGRDPREELPGPVLRSDVLKAEDLQPGMKLKGVVRNVVDFGAFVDIGVKQDALLHISQIADKFIKHPLDEISVGDIIDVTILEVDNERGRISVTRKNTDLA